MKKTNKHVILALLLAVMLLTGLCDWAYAEEPVRYPYLTSLEMVDVAFNSTGVKFDEGKDGTPIGIDWNNYEDAPRVSQNTDYCDYVLGSITVYTNGIPTKKLKQKAQVTPIYTLANSDLVTEYTTASGNRSKTYINAGTMRSDIIRFITADGTRYGYELTVVDGSSKPVEPPTEITLESIAVNRTAEDTATAYIKSNVAGTYYCAVTEINEEPSFDTTAEGTELHRYVNTIQLTNLTAGAKKLHILAKSADLTDVTVSFDIPKNADAHSLSASTSLIWEDQDDKDTNRKGNVVFTNQSGTTITSAIAGETVTATATARNFDGSWYEFSFVQWKDETGITLKEAQRKTNTVTFEMPDEDVTLFAEFKNVGTTVTWGSNPREAPAIMVNGNIYGTQYVYRTGSSANVNFKGADWEESWVILGWEIMIDGVNRTHDPDYVTYQEVNGLPIVKLAGENVTITAKFRPKAFASVTADVNDAAMGSATVAVGAGEAAASQSVVYEGQTVTLTATPGERYTLKGWEVKDADSNDVTYTVAEDANVATFIMPDTGKDITAKAIFEVDPDKASNECNVTGVNLYSGSTDGAPINQGFAKEGTKLTITLPANMDTVNLADLILKFTVSDYATIKQKDATENWPADGKACGMALDTPVTFTVTAEDGKTTQDYTLTITKAKSSEKEITAVKLLNSDKSVIAEGVQAVSGTTWTITLPSDTDKALIGKIGTSTDVFMQIDYTGVSLAQAEGYSDASAAENKKWSSGNIMCGISPNSSKTFTVTAEDGSTKEYTVEIKYTAPDVPTLSDGSATRTSKTGATVKFTSNEAGMYFYKVVEHGAAAPTVDTSKNGTAAVKGENAITLSNLTEDARDIYIVVKNASGGESAALKVEIPAYGSSETPDTGKFTITVNAPTKGGTLTTNRTKADKGDEIIVTVKPDSGYQMVEGSLTYSLAVAGGETVKITGNRFTMPSGNVTITCKWETASVVSSGITGFSINGVAGTVNSTTNTITITMPRGTDVTKLTPAISTSGVKSLTPGSGETVNFTNSVTYTATMDDGSTRTYIVTVYVDKGTLADQFWDRLTDFYQQVPWWKYAEQQQSSSKYPKYW